MVDPALLAEALRHADALDPARRCGLAAAEVGRRVAVGQPGAPHLAAQARELAALVADPDATRAVARAEVALFLASWGPATIAERLDRAEALLARAAGDPAVEPTAVHLVRVARLEAGQVAASHRASRRFAELAAARPDPDLQLTQVEWESMWDLLRGDHDTAHARIEAMAVGLDRLAPAAATALRVSVSTVAGIAAWNENRLVELVPDTEVLATDADEDYRLVTPLGLAQGGRAGEAVALTGQLLADVDKWDGPRATSRTALLAEALVTVLEPDPPTAVRRAALELLDRLAGCLEDWQDGLVVLWPGSVCLGPTALYRGSVRAALGRAGAAADLRRALDTTAALGARPYQDRAARRLTAV
jgi:hypothetical protein